jgi:Flp pilus assembly protein TadG
MKRRSEAGQAIAAVAFGLVALVGVVGLAIDMGYMRYEKRRLQSAADSAAIAAASELQYSSGTPSSAALNDSKANGFEDSVNGVTVTPHIPPIDGPFSGRANYAEVTVQQTAPTFFMRIFGVNSTTLNVTAVAKLGSSRGCVYTLGLILGLNLGGNNLTAPGCGVVDNALLNLGGGCLTAESIGVVLNVLGGCTIPAPILNIAPTADPLAYLVPPGFGACLPNPNVNQPAGPAVVLNPGTYCAGITIQPTNAVAVVLNPGLYVLNGAPGLQIQGTGDVTGNGVEFYITGLAGVQVTGTGNVTLSAPVNALAASPGIPGGVLFFQDRLNPLPAHITAGNLNLAGALYFPVAQLTLGATNPSPYLILVSDSIQTQGNITIGTDYSTLADGSPIRAAVLVQ